MLGRCPDAILLGCATLVDYRLAFTIFSPKRQCGCADIMPSIGDVVCGLLYRMTNADRDAMDVFEGHPIHYRRVTVRVKSENGEVKACSYEVVNKQDGLRPSYHYLGLLQSAAARFEFPEKYQLLLRNIETVK